MTPRPQPLKDKGSSDCPPRIRTWTKGSKDRKPGVRQSKRSGAPVGRTVAQKDNPAPEVSRPRLANLHANTHADPDPVRAELRRIMTDDYTALLGSSRSLGGQE